MSVLQLRDTSKPSTSPLPSDPLAFCKLLWPHVKFYQQQVDVIYSVADNKETYVPAGNMLGKDFVSGFIAVWYFLTRFPCRIVTTSAKDDHLRVLWGEIQRFIQTASRPLELSKGGPLIVNQREINRSFRGERCKISYIIGMVASSDSIAAMGGHHVANIGDGIPRTLLICDEASSVPTEYYEIARPWANRILVIGNAWPCDNFFKWAVKGNPATDDPGGDIPRKRGKGYYRKIIRIKATDSPNVRLGLKEIREGKEPSNKVLIPGVKGYEEYESNLAMWDEHQKCVSLDADWYEGRELFLFPTVWLNRAEEIALALLSKSRKAKTMGVDSAMGGDSTSWYVIDELGVMDFESMKTPDTSVIIPRTLALMRKHDLRPESVLFDMGGGGKQHADTMRKAGYNVRLVAFGETATSVDRFRNSMRTRGERREESETQYVYVNRRAEMYGLLSELMNPVYNPRGFGIPKRCVELRRQLKVIPKTFDGEGRLWVIPKSKKDKDSKQMTLTELLGRSPDDADALVLAVYGLLVKPTKRKAGGLG